MRRSDPTYRAEAMSASEVDSFLDEMLTELFDLDLTSDSDSVPDLGRYNEIL